MPSLKIHTAISRKRTGYNFEELHEWIDAPQKQYGSDHRIERHAYNERDAEKIERYWDEKKGPGWGKKAVIEWLFHIAIDNIDTAFKVSKRRYQDNTYTFFAFGLSSTGYIHFDFQRLNDQELNEIFEEEGIYDDEPDGILTSLIKKIF